MRKIEMFGNENDTFVTTKNGMFLVTSVDTLERIERVKALPEDVVSINPNFFEELMFSGAELEEMFG